MKQATKIALLLLRIIVGWHFIYEGIIKLFQPEWSSVGYLQGSVGFLSGFYHWMASSPGLVGRQDEASAWRQRGE
jgi:thiosulfate dehydrogenase [quinone] large subunit